LSCATPTPSTDGGDYSADRAEPALRQVTPEGNSVMKHPSHVGRSPGGIGDLARRRPIAVLLTTLLAPTYLAYAVVLLTGLPFMIGQIAQLAFMIAAPVMVSAWIGGRAAVRRVFAGLLRWRIGVARSLLVLTALPLVSLLVAATTGSLDTPADGWAHQALMYGLFLGYGALSANLWEETVWSSFVQGRLMVRHGLLNGSLLTAVPFAAIHLPLGFHDGLEAATTKDVIITWTFMIALAPFLRYLIGTLLVDTGGSTLAAGLLHASMNAAMAMSVLGGGWQALVALIVVTLVVAAHRFRTGRSAVQGFAATLASDQDQQQSSPRARTSSGVRRVTSPGQGGRAGVQPPLNGTVPLQASTPWSIR
jgi:membrane protease YdiL (CAAX protease family)